ncbi:MAG TPA: hypothetical protein VFQ68_07320, partial [Streptosporangiaceae bacterium]|nr:hypothetical protein [Streptosporangiaceae bacterium]
TPNRRSGHVTGPDGTDSQADSAGSIPVTRSTDEMQVRGFLRSRIWLDTSIMIRRRRIAPEELPDEMAISAVTLAELSAGPHEVRPGTEQDLYFEATERARRPRAVLSALLIASLSDMNADVMSLSRHECGCDVAVTT